MEIENQLLQPRAQMRMQAGGIPPARTERACTCSKKHISGVPRFQMTRVDVRKWPRGDSGRG